MGETTHLQDCATPFGTFEAVSERGIFMGNHGNLRQPDASQKIWHSPGWVCCLASFRHHPYGECRPTDYKAFKQTWRRAFRMPDHVTLTASGMDKLLGKARISRRPTGAPFARRRATCRPVRLSLWTINRRDLSGERWDSPPMEPARLQRSPAAIP